MSFCSDKLSIIVWMRYIFGVGGKPIFFGREEFGLVIWLNFGPLPSIVEFKKDVTSSRLQNQYFMGKDAVKVSELEIGLENCMDDNDVFKMWLCLLVEGILRGKDIWSNTFGWSC